MKKLLPIGVLQICLAYAYVAQTQPAPSKSPTAQVATQWADMTVKIMTKAPKNTPTYGSRATGYLGLTMYETVVYASPKHKSVFRQMCDTIALPKPEPKKAYCWELSLNAGQAYMLKALYAYTGKTQPIDSLEQVIHQLYAAQLSPEVVERSEQFGKAIATKIYEWSKVDGGHEGYSRNFPESYIRPVGTGIWVPPLIGQSNTKIPMHPTWGENRTFSQWNRKLPLPKPLVYSTDTNSIYCIQYKEVFDRKKSLSLADRIVVMWWGDDPTETCSPPGHSYNLATIAIRGSSAGLVKAAETYARVGMAVADAFVCCWKAKFIYMAERPSSFIQKEIQSKYSPKWLPFFLEPPFPAFYSGHSVQSAATATVLTELYGKNFSFIDDTHANRPDKIIFVQNDLPSNPTPSDFEHYLSRPISEYTLKYKPRHYKSFWDAAQECANSRLLGGIHTRHDNEVGLVEGTKIGSNINALRWH